MLEKSGIPVLTSEDVKEYNLGIVSDRIKETWDFSLDELKDVVSTKQIISVPKESTNEKLRTPD